jgi:hypothetical protein
MSNLFRFFGQSRQIISIPDGGFSLIHVPVLGDVDAVKVVNVVVQHPARHVLARERISGSGGRMFFPTIFRRLAVRYLGRHLVSIRQSIEESLC